MAAPKVRILIPPSEGKQPGGDRPSLKDWPEGSEEMLTRLAKVKSAEWEKLLGVKGKALAQAVAANRKIRTAPTLPASKTSFSCAWWATRACNAFERP